MSQETLVTQFACLQLTHMVKVAHLGSVCKLVVRFGTIFKCFDEVVFTVDTVK